MAGSCYGGVLSGERRELHEIHNLFCTLSHLARGWHPHTLVN